MTILVPPAIFEKEDAVLDLPVIANGCQQFRGSNGAGIDTAKKVARIGQPHGAIVRDDIAVHSQSDLAAREGQRFANVLGVL
jgi:hypothetical protein